MTSLPERILSAWANRDGYAVLTTVDSSGTPNSIYVGAMREAGNGTVIVADNYFHKTRANIHGGSRGSLLFLTKEKKAYQLKGTFEYHTSGPVFDDMKQWNPPQHPGVAAAVLKVEDIYCGAERVV